MFISSSTGRSTFSTLWRGFLTFLLAVAVLPVLDVPAEKRPAKHPEFGEGLKAFKQEAWETVADRMLKAVQAWGEDGELTRVYGRSFEPYVPRYYLGAALYELGCYELSQRQLEESILSREEIKGAKTQLDELESLKLKSDSFVRQGVSQDEGAQCGDWRARIEELEAAAPPLPKPKEFILGIRALDVEAWEQAARLFEVAQAKAPADGEPINIYGYRYESYLPHYYRGVALSRIGKCEEALREWEMSEAEGHVLKDKKSYRSLQQFRNECGRET